MTIVVLHIKNIDVVDISVWHRWSLVMFICKYDLINSYLPSNDSIKKILSFRVIGNAGFNWNFENRIQLAFRGEILLRIYLKYNLKSDVEKQIFFNNNSSTKGSMFLWKIRVKIFPWYKYYELNKVIFKGFFFYYLNYIVFLNILQSVNSLHCKQSYYN